MELVPEFQNIKKVCIYQLKALALVAALQVQAAHSATSHEPVQDVERATSVQLLYKSESSANPKLSSHFPEVYIRIDLRDYFFTVNGVYETI